jgi:hypothetical protein
VVGDLPFQRKSLLKDKEGVEKQLSKAGEPEFI